MLVRQIKESVCHPIFSDLISLWEITYKGLNWVNIMQGKNEFMEFLSGKVFFIFLG
jgi:hypothetical protein